MNDTQNRLTLVSLFLLIAISTFSQAPVQGKVVFANGDPAEGIAVYFEGIDQPSLSDESGLFPIPSTADLDKISIIKRGYELAGTIIKDKKLSITVRAATIKRIKGRLLSRSNKPLGEIDITLQTASQELSETTDAKGLFVFKIPYQEEIDISSALSIQSLDFQIKDLTEDLDRGEISFAAVTSLPEEEFMVTLKDEDGKLIRNSFVLVGTKPFVTNNSGVFYTDASTVFTESSVQVDNYSVASIQELNDKEFEITLASASSAGSQNATASTLLQAVIDSLPAKLAQADTSLFSGEKLSNRIDSLVAYYTIQQSKFKEQNQKILDIRDSLSFLPELSDEEQEKILNQALQFDESINLLDSLFQDTKANSLELILLLREKLRQQEQEIKEIEEEKIQITESFRKNVKTFLAIIFGFILLLLIAIWIIRRFSIQKRVIETTKKQLIHAQNMAKIGSMAYNFKKQSYDYSDNFFDTLRIPSRITGEMTRDSRKDIYDLFVSKKDKVRVHQAWEEGLKEKKPIKVEFQGISDDEKAFYLDMNTRFGVGENGEVDAISTTLQDITEKKKHELSLLAAVEKAEDASKVKDQFLSSMSHEIRTPLNAILGITDFMLSDKPKKDHIPKLNTLHFSGQHLLALVNDILDFSKIKSGRLRLEVSDFSVEQLLQNIMLTLSFSVKEKGIKLYYLVDKDVPAFISGDRLKVNQVLINLVGNAIKFTEKGEVKVNVERKEEMIVFSVTDTGIGIDEDKLEKIFVGFEQENISTARKYGGTGLGLSISRELSQLLGGGLEVESEIGVGSVFSFSIPFIEVQDRDADETITSFLDETNVLKGLRVLCVEDNEINQMVIEQYFEKWGVISTFADTASEAIDRVKGGEFDLIFMDIRLPDMTGYEATKKILEEVENFMTPIVALTAEIDEMTELKIKDAGMVGFMGKPFKPEELHETLLIYTDDTYQDLSEEEKEIRRKQIEKSRKQIIAADESRPDDQEISVQTLKEHWQNKEALEFFVSAFSIRVDEFRIAYENAMYNKDIKELDNITHNIIPHLKLLGMHNMEKVIKGYIELDLDDQDKVKEVVDKVESYRVLIKETLADLEQELV